MNPAGAKATALGYPAGQAMGLDYAWGRPKPELIAAAGYRFVLRYLAPLPNSKVISAGELQALHSAGIGVGLVWESYASRCLEGTAAGHQDGASARLQAAALGFPPGWPIFGAVDMSPSQGQLAAIGAYLEAAGFHPYGNGAVCTYMAARGCPGHSWLMDWGGHNYPDFHLHQTGGQEVVDGVQCDVNVGLTLDCIWFPVGAGPQPQPASQPQPVHFEGDNVTKLSVHVPALDDQGNGSVTIPGVAGRLVGVIVNGNDPNHEGYDGNRATFESSARGSDELLVIQGGKPHTGFDLNVWVAG